MKRYIRSDSFAVVTRPKLLDYLQNQLGLECDPRVLARGDHLAAHLTFIECEDDDFYKYFSEASTLRGWKPDDLVRGQSNMRQAMELGWIDSDVIDSSNAYYAYMKQAEANLKSLLHTEFPDVGLYVSATSGSRYYRFVVSVELFQ